MTAPTVEPAGLTAAEHGAALSHPRAEILALTGLRGLAMLGIVVHNVRLPSSVPGPLRNLAEASYLAMPLFVLLSGFVLAYNYPRLSLRSGHRALGRFYVARFARIVPLTVAVSVYLLVMNSAYSADGWLRRIFAEQAWAIILIVCLYVAFPVLLPMVRSLVDRRGTRGLATALGVAFGAQLAIVVMVFAAGGFDQDSLRIHSYFYRNPLTWVPLFTLGIGLAFAATSGFALRVRTANLIQAACVLGVGALACLRLGPAAGRFVQYGAVWAIPFGLVILTLAVSRRSVLARFLSTRVMVHLGVVGLAWFLIHREVLNGLGWRLAHGDGLPAYLMVVAITGLTLLIAEGAHRYLEAPARGAVLAVARRLDRRSSTPAASAKEPVAVRR